MAGDEISEEGRRTRFALWEQLGLDQVKHDLLNGGHRVVGGPPQVRALAWEWVRRKEAEQMDDPQAAARTLGLGAATSSEILRALGVSNTAISEKIDPGIDVAAIMREVGATFQPPPFISSPAPNVVPATTGRQPPSITQRPEVVTLKPAFMGMSVDIKELWRRSWPWVKGRLSKSS